MPNKSKELVVVTPDGTEHCFPVEGQSSESSQSSEKESEEVVVVTPNGTEHSFPVEKQSSESSQSAEKEFLTCEQAGMNFERQVIEWIGTDLANVTFCIPPRSFEISWREWGRRIHRNSEGKLDITDYTEVIFWFVCKAHLKSHPSTELQVLLEPALCYDTPIEEKLAQDLIRKLPILIARNPEIELSHGPW
jgi:hypothetical protein